MMTMKKSSLAFAILLSQVFYISAFSQKPSDTPDEELPRVFTKPDGTQVTARIDKYSKSSGMVRVITKDGEYIERPFDQIAPENQKIILEWKMNQVVQSSSFDVTYARKKGDETTGYIRGTDIKVDKDVYYHELTIENESDVPVTGLQVYYAIAYERRQSAGLGLRNPEDGQGFRAVTLPVMDIGPGEKKVVVTPPITLKSFQNVESSGNNSNNREGGGQSTEEYEGVVFRFTRNGVALRDVANPPSIANRSFNLDKMLDNAPVEPKKAR